MDSYLIDEINLTRNDKNVVHLQIYHTSSIIPDKYHLHQKRNNVQIRDKTQVIARDKYKVVCLKKNDYDIEKITESHSIKKPSKNNIPLVQYTLSFMDIKNIVFPVYFMEAKKKYKTWVGTKNNTKTDESDDRIPDQNIGRKIF